MSPLYRNPDGTIAATVEGVVMAAPTQEEFEACCCESGGEPCSDCLVDQPDAEVTGVEGSPLYLCDIADGVYISHTHNPTAGGCGWDFLGPSIGSAQWILSINYNYASGLWDVGLWRNAVRYFRNTDAAISCTVEGVLTGTITLTDIDNCSGSPVVVLNA